RFSRDWSSDVCSSDLRLVLDIAKVLNQKIDEVAFVIGKDFGKKVEEDLVNIAESLDAKGSIYYQDEALGTGHAIMCAKNSLSGRSEERRVGKECRSRS